MSKENRKEPIRIAHVIGKLYAGGVESVIYNYYRHIDRTKYQFDFIIDADSKIDPPQEIIDLGARFYTVPPYQKLPQYMKELIRLFRKNRYQIVHSSMNSLSVFSLCAAWIAKVPVRICHNHSTAARGETKKNILKYILRPFAKIFPTHLCACSRLAGEWLFGKRAMKQGKVTIFNNAIETEKFAFDPVVRSEVRKEFGIEDCFVIGHVGRFCFQKNQEFLIDLLPMILEEKPNAILLLVGIGEIRNEIENKVKQMGLCESVIFTGARKDIHRLYQAMDVFVFPSRYEGLGIVSIEAQCAGLPVIASVQVPKEAKASDNICFLPLDDIVIWVNAIKKGKNNNRSNPIDKKFDINFEALKLQYYYDISLDKKQ